MAILPIASIARAATTRCHRRHWYGAIAFFVLLVSHATTASSASTVGFDVPFVSAAAPFAVTECDALCSSPGTVNFQLNLVRSGSLAATDTIYVSTRSTSDLNAPSAIAGDDYTALTNVAVEFRPSESTKSVVVTVISDGVYEDDEYFEAVLTSPSNGVTIDGNAQVAYMKIVDGGDAGIFAFSANTYSFSEDAGSVQVKVTRTGGASGGVTVTYRLANPGLATAINAKNFQLTDAIYELTFDDRQREAFIPIRIINDSLYEAQEFFYLELSALSPMKASDATASVAKFGATRTAAVFIVDDGDAGRFDFATPYVFCRENNGSAVVSIVRSLGSSSSSYTPVTLTLTTVGTSGGSNATEGGSLAFDYLATSDKLSWGNAETRKTFAVKIFNNKNYEPVTRAFKIRMTTAEGGASIGPQSEIWVYIVDDRDAGTLSFKQAQYEVLENAGSVTVEIVRTGLVDASGINTYSSGSVSVDVASFAGTILPGKQKYDDDYDNGVVQARKCTHLSPCTAAANVAYMPVASTTITFADGEISKNVTIPILDDTLYEAPDQVFKVILRNAAFGAHIGIDYEHPPEWFGYRTAFLEIDKRRNELPDFVGTIVTIKDDGDPAVLVSKASLSISELGQTDNYDVWLNSEPQADVSVEFSCVVTELKLSVSTLTFTSSNWATRQTVVVTAVTNKRTRNLPNSDITMSVSSSDTLYNGTLRQSLAQTIGFTFGAKIYTEKPGTYDTGNAQHSFPWSEGFGVMTSPQTTQDIVAFTLDNNPAGVVINPEAVRHSSASGFSPQTHVAVRVNGHKAAFSVSLSSEPAGSVTITLVAVVDDGIKVSPSTLTFTPSNWNVVQPVEVEAISSSKSGIESGVYYTSIRVVASSTADPFYNRPNTAMATIFVARYPVALVLLDASKLDTRENDRTGPSSASYQVQLASEPMHWEPKGSQQYTPYKFVLPATADTMLTLSSDAPVTAPPAGSATTFSVAANASISSVGARIVRIGVLRFSVNPVIASVTGSHQVGGAKLRLYRVSGGENGGLGGVTVGVAVADGSISETWDETQLRANCVSDANANVECSLRNTVTAVSLPLSALFPASTSFANIRSATFGETLIQPTGMFDSTANVYVSTSGWVDIDITVAVNAFLARQHEAEQSLQPFASDLTFLIYTTAPSFFTYNGATEVIFASNDHSEASLRPQLHVLGSGRANLALSASVSQSHPGSAQAAIDGQTTSNLGVASTFAMSSTPYKFPWWQADLGSIRLIDEVVVTVKRRVSAASLTPTQLPVYVWLMLSETPLSDHNVDGVTGFTVAKTGAQLSARFDVVRRSFTASEDEIVVLRWRVSGTQGAAAFGDDHFHADYSATIEARYFLLQVEGENNIVLNEVEIFQPALASAKLSLGGYMPSPSVVNKGKNQIQFQLDQPDEQVDSDCDPLTMICRRELLFTSGDWWQPQTVRVSVADDAVATGDRDILLTHTLQSTEAAFHGTSVCATAGLDPCRPGLFNESGVKTLRILDDDENVVLFSASALEVEEGSVVYPNAPRVRREQRVFPASVRCSTDPTKVLNPHPNEAADCANVFIDSAASWETCIQNPSAGMLTPGSAWLMAGFAETDINVTEITLTIPQMQGATYARRISLWWSTSLDLNASTTSSLLDIQSWTKICSIDITMMSNGPQTIRTSELGLASIKVLLVAFDTSYDDVANCLVVPSVIVRARVAVPFPLAVRGDLTNHNSIAPNESGRSRMHQVGTTAKLQVRLASEPVQDITIAVIADANNALLTVFAASQSPLARTQAALIGGYYESGEVVTFTAPTTLVFSPRNWNVSQELTFLAIDDNIFNANRSFSVSHVATSTENTTAVIPQQTYQNNQITRSFSAISANLAFTQAPFIVATERESSWPRHWTPKWSSDRGTITVSVIDDDIPGVTISCSSVTVSENAITPGNYSIALDSAPKSDVTVAISYAVDDTLLTVSPLRLTFTPSNWKSPQFVFIKPVPNDIYDAGAPLTIDYDRLIAKKAQPVLVHKLTSLNDAVYNGLAVGSNEPDRTTAYVVNQGVVAIVQDEDTGCPREYVCVNGGVCVNTTYGGSVGSSSASVCRCPVTYGMRNCGAGCANERDCTFSRVEFLLRCQPNDPLAICGNSFSPSRLASTLYRMLTNDDLETASGKRFAKLALVPMTEAMYIVNATASHCADATGSSSVCVNVVMDFSKAAGTTSNPVVAKLQGYLESGSLQTQPIFAELMTVTQQYPQNLGATIAVWIFVSFCAASIGGVALLFAVRYFKFKRSHVQPDLGPGDVTEPLTAATNFHAQ